MEFGHKALREKMPKFMFPMEKLAHRVLSCKHAHS